MNIFDLGLPLADGSGYRPRVNSLISTLVY